jgi:putative restriction endonuclease
MPGEKKGPGKCAISSCDAEQALEAAHIQSYLGAETDRVENGLLLRADLHTLFDIGLLAVEPQTLTVLLAPRLTSGSYASLHGAKIRVPRHQALRPSPEALQAHRGWCGL